MLNIKIITLLYTVYIVSGIFLNRMWCQRFDVELFWRYNDCVEHCLRYYYYRLRADMIIGALTNKAS